MAVNPALVKRFSERSFRRLWNRDSYVHARYCPVDTVSCLPEDCITYGSEVCVREIHEGEPLMLTISINWKSQGYEVPITDIAVSKNSSYK